MKNFYFYFSNPLFERKFQYKKIKFYLTLCFEEVDDTKWFTLVRFTLSENLWNQQDMLLEWNLWKKGQTPLLRHTLTQKYWNKKCLGSGRNFMITDNNWTTVIIYTDFLAIKCIIFNDDYNNMFIFFKIY